MISVVAATPRGYDPLMLQVIDTSEVVPALRRVFGDDRVSTDPAELATMAHDALRRSRGASVALPQPELPLAVIRPQSTEEVQRAVRFAFEQQVPIVELGGGTGLMGGARTVRPGIVIDMRAMNRVLEVNREDRTVRAQAGTVLQDVDEALQAQGLMLGHDPWTVPIATVGGTISTNSLGYRGAQYGSMGDQVLGLDVVLGDGSLLTVRRRRDRIRGRGSNTCLPARRERSASSRRR